MQEMNPVKNKIHTMALLLILLISGCDSPAPALSPLSGDAIILAFGDSLTHGSGVQREHSYPAVLESLTGRSVINAGLPGELSRQGMARLPGLLDDYRPDLLILCHGGNDILRKLNRTVTLDNLKAMVMQAQQRGIEVVLVGVPELKLFSSKPAPLYDRLAGDLGLAYLRDTLPVLERTTSMKSDHVHLNEEGYNALAHALFDLLKDHGAL